ncbi:MAG: adenylate cyclase [Clostridiales bacterium]|nr:adenylate cyclase [Clostridiales bacterium]MDN5281005.1 adenylate cyclase [Candidatus Ozemobacter sp.]
MSRTSAKQKLIAPSRSFFIVTMVCFVMIGILMILNYADKALRQAEVERATSEARDKLLLDLRLLQKAAVAEVHFGSNLYSKLSELAESVPEGENWQRLIDKHLQAETQSWSGQPAWFIYDYEQLNYFSGLSGQPPANNAISGGQKHAFSEKIVRYFCLKGTYNFTNIPIPLEIADTVGEYFEAAIDEKVAKDQSDFIRSSMARFKEIRIDDEPFYIAWFPLFKRDWAESPLRFSKIDLAKFDKRQLAMMHLHGLVALVFSDEDFAALRKKDFRRALIENYARTGCKIRFKRYASLNQNEQKRFLIPQTHLMKDGRLVGTARVLLDEYFLVFAERVSELDTRLAKSKRILGFILKLCWFVFGLLVVGNYFIMGRQIEHKIVVQLIVFILWILFPAYYIGYCATERYVLEKQTASMSYLKSGLSELTRAFDSSIELYKTWVCDRISTALDKSVAGRKIDLKTMSESEARFLLDSIQRELLANGVFSKNLILVDSGGRIYSYLFGADSKEKKFFQSFFRAFYLPTITSRIKDVSDVDNKAGSDLLLGAQAEELVSIARSIVPVRSLSEMAIKRVSLDHFEGLGDQAFIFHKYLGQKTEASTVIQVGIFLPSIERNCMLDWIENYSDSKFKNLDWVISRRDSPSWFLRAPFWKAIKTGKMGLLNPVYDFLPERLLFWSHVGNRLSEPFSTTIDFAGKKVLFSSFKGQSMLEYQIGALLPLDNHYQNLERFHRGLLLAVTAIFIVCALIGFRMARGFMEPVKSLAENAERIMAGNFSARIGDNWEDSEIFELGRSFDKVAADLETGRTLKKFVSDSALEVIQGKSEERTNLRKNQAVVLFLRLDNFWSQTQSMAPEKAVFELNRFFSLVCREAAMVGCDVNKFIGEKTLAVFRIDSEDSVAEVARAAANFSLKLVQISASLDGIFSNCRIRVGITLGKVLSGTIGGEDTRLEQTLVGDTVNLASRLCTFKSEYSILTNSLFAEALNSADAESLQVVKIPDQVIKGKKEAVSIYALKKSGEI